MNRNLLPLTLFGVGFLMVYSGYKNLHPIDGVLKPILRGDKPGTVPLTGPVTPDAMPGVTPTPDFQKLGGTSGGGSPAKPTYNTPVPPSPGSASGGSSGSGTSDVINV